MSLDRIDPDGHYEPGNVRWADAKTQVMNRRVSRRLTYKGITLSPQEWSDRTGLPYQTIWARMNENWTDVRVLETPLYPPVWLRNVYCPCCGEPIPIGPFMPNLPAG